MSQTRGRVLVVDDEIDTARTLGCILAADTPYSARYFLFIGTDNKYRFRDALL